MTRVPSLTVVFTIIYLNSLLGQASNAALSRQVFLAESSFAATMAQRDLEAFAGFLSTEAVFFSDAEALRGKAAVVEGWRQFFVGPEAPFSWSPEIIEVLSSGTLALSSGPVRDLRGHRIATFNSIWRRESDGSWRVIKRYPQQQLWRSSPRGLYLSVAEFVQPVRPAITLGIALAIQTKADSKQTQSNPAGSGPPRSQLCQHR